MQISSLFNNYSVENPLNLESVANKKITTDSTDSSTKMGFEEVLLQAIQSVNNSQIDANQKIEGLIKGDENINMHDVTIALQESQMSMELLIQVRNKLYDCYQQLNSVTL